MHFYGLRNLPLSTDYAPKTAENAQFQLVYRLNGLPDVVPQHKVPKSHAHEKITMQY